VCKIHVITRDKIARKAIIDVSNEFLKSNKINRYKTLIKREKSNYINRKAREAFVEIWVPWKVVPLCL
jgi:hypothetical protein